MSEVKNISIESEEHSLPSGPSPEFLKLIQGKMSQDEYSVAAQARISLAQDVLMLNPPTKRFSFGRRRQAA